MIKIMSSLKNYFKNNVKKEITHGDIFQISLTIISIIFAYIGIKGTIINQTENIKTGLEVIFQKPQTTNCRENESYVFDNNESSFLIRNINAEKGEVAVQINLRGTITDETLSRNKSKRIYLRNSNLGYSFIVTKVYKEKSADIVTTKIAKE